MKGKLVKRMTEDGLMSVEDTTPTGRVYDLVPGSRRVARLWNVEHGVEHQKEIVNIADDDGGFFPTELLEITDA